MPTRRSFVRAALGAAALLWPLTLSAATAAPAERTSATVLIIHAESTRNAAFAQLVAAIESELRSGVPYPITSHVEAIDTTRFPSAAYDGELAAMYRARYEEGPPDLVIALGEPALDFNIRHRAELFPAVPLLFGFVDERMVDRAALRAGIVGTFAKIDARRSLELALALHPTARRAIVVGGTSRFDRSWQAIVREDLRTLPVPVADWTDFALKDLLAELTGLGRDTIVLYVSMTRDGSGTPMVSLDVFQKIRRVTDAPLYGVSARTLGYGIVGGALLDFDRHAADLARQAQQLLAGRPAAEMRPVTTEPIVAADWRELKRFGIDPASLPPDVAVRFREPRGGAEQAVRIVAWAAAIALQALMIAALVRQRRRRRQLEELLVGKERFEVLLTDVLLAIAKIPARRGDTADEMVLRRIAEASGADHVWCWTFGDPRDPDWTSLRLRAGEPTVFDGAGDLPQPVGEALAAIAPDGWSVAAMPLNVGAVVFGALFLARRPARGAPARPAVSDGLRLVIEVFASDLQRRRAEEALGTSDALKGAILSSLPHHVAVLDWRGVVIAVNRVWTEHVGDRGDADYSIAPGAHYPDILAAAARAGAPEAADAQAGVAGVCEGRLAEFALEYVVEAPDDERWFSLSVAPLRWEGGGAVVVHQDVTSRKRAEVALRESEDRFRLLADALPVAVRMSDGDGGCTYFNKTWLDLTGRPLERELGDGWLEGVHPDDRASCLAGYRRQIDAREPFVIQYRIRDHDGEYRHLLDRIVPRCDDEGRFLGYVGGAIDFTEFREVERELRDLSGQLISAQEDERRRIARELHDNVAQRLALLAIRTDTVAQLLPETSPHARAEVAAIRSAAAEVSSEVHAISHQLHSSKLDALGLVEAVRAHCGEMSTLGLDVEFADVNMRPQLPAGMSLGLFRVVQEALANVVKHSGAPAARVTLTGTAQTVVLTIEDRGRGFDASTLRPGSLGLVSMRERLRSLHGHLIVASTPGVGTILAALVPLGGEASAAA